jgi:propanol-preferring alcohol dehydrogenase
MDRREAPDSGAHPTEPGGATPHPSATMRAMVFEEVGRPLRARELPIPAPGARQLLLRVRACGVCRTDLHLVDGEVEIASPPRVLGHQIVGEVIARRGTAEEPGLPAHGQLVGVPWLGWTDGDCEYCTSGRENLCPRARFTGRDIDGGFAEYTVADTRYCFPLEPGHPDEQLAPLLCAGLIGYRALRMCGEARRIGLYGFGASAHIIAQVARWQGREVFAFTTRRRPAGAGLALELGASWAGASEDPRQTAQAAIIFAPVGALVPVALRARSGGTVVRARASTAERHPELPPRAAVGGALGAVGREPHPQRRPRAAQLARQAGVRTHVTTYPLERTGDALEDLRAGAFTGAAVVVL